jgi:chromosome segregation protein
MLDKGAHYFRTDLQVHTPRDTQWSGVRPSDENERTRFAESFVAHCRSVGLKAVAITDHHDLAMVPYIRRAANLELDSDGEPLAPESRLVVFPGLELTLSVPCQALLILDADFPEERFDDILKLLNFEPVDPALQFIPQTQPLPDSGSINDLQVRLDMKPWLAGRYILLPNVTPGGYKTLLRTSFQDKYKDMPCVGGYFDGDISKAAKKKKQTAIIDGEDRNWGSKRLATFQTSDSRSGDFEQLGNFGTWIKWAEPTAEALRQACLAQESRISQVEPLLPSVWITHVQVSASKFMGRVDLRLNPQYNAVIGGRGTGKSTLLDYIRWALCDQPASAQTDDEVADPRARQRKLIGATLASLDAHVEVYFSLNGIPHAVRRYARNGEVRLRVGSEGDFELAKEVEVQSLLPVHAYSQKQLSSVSIRPEELLRFVTAPIARQLEDIDRRSSEVAGRLRENYASLLRARQLDAEVRRSALRVESLTSQAKAVRDSLAGLSDEDRAVLDSKGAYDSVADALDAWRRKLTSVAAALAEAQSSAGRAIEGIAVPEECPDELEDTMTDLAGRVHSAIQGVVARLQEESTALQADVSTGAIAGALGSIQSMVDDFEARYTRVKAESTTQETRLQELAEIERQRTEAKAALDAQKESRAEIGDPQSKHGAIRAEYVELQSERAVAMTTQCVGLVQDSAGLILAMLSLGRGLEAVRERFRAMIHGSSVRGTTVDKLFEELSDQSSPRDVWENVLADLEILMDLETDAGVSTETAPELSRLGFDPANQRRCASKITPDAWLDLALTPIADEPEFRYRSKSSEYIPFEAASAGQQATALLTVLLAQTGMPLIIDQPEEDLDSEIVLDIVEKIWDAKTRRQLIFSSHNANLVVNGDADLVVGCAYLSTGDQSAGHIKVEGAIDVEDVRNEITKVMEGGEKAFRLRQEKYGF